MATQKIQYSTKSRLPCGCTSGAGVIVCVSSSLTTSGKPFIAATIVSEETFSNGTYQYLLSFDDTQLAGTLLSSGIRGAFCKGCLTDWVESIVSGITCVTNTDTINLTIGGDGCLSADAVGAGGDFWSLIGNAGTVDGTNFIGTTDNVAHDVRVNNERARRTEPNAGCPRIIDGEAGNTADGIGSAILSGGNDNINNTDPAFVIHNSITAGYFSLICGGQSNYIIESPTNPDVLPYDFSKGCSVIVGGEFNFIDDSVVALTNYEFKRDVNFIGGGTNNEIHAAGESVIVGGESNRIDYADLFTSLDAASCNSAVAYYPGDFVGGGEGNRIFGVTPASADFPCQLGWNIIGGGTANRINNGINNVVAGGVFNIISKILQGGATSNFNTISGGNGNDITGDGCVIGGGGATPVDFGSPNIISSGWFSTIGGGAKNTINPDAKTDISFEDAGYSTIAGGKSNRIVETAQVSWNLLGLDTVGGGWTNVIESTDFATISGGAFNYVQYIAADSFISGHAHGDTVGGGNQNGIYWNNDVAGTITSYLGHNTIAGGRDNNAVNSIYSTIAGGANNIIDSANVLTDWTRNLLGPWNSDFIGGGYFNLVSDSARSSVVGGGGNIIYGNDSSAILGGYLNQIINSTPVAAVVGPSAVGSTVDPPATIGVGNSIYCGEANEILDGRCSSIGGAFLKAGSATFGYQSPLTRTFTDIAGAARDYSNVLNRIVTPQVDISAFSALAYFGDVDLWIANTDSTARAIKFFEPNADLDFSSTNYSSFKAQSQGANIDYVLPATAGTAGQQLTIDTVVGTVVTLKWA